ncbi:MAG: hypothetical protein UU65_C0004G0087 [candidate division CPR2 bacterium GW2011_GWC1_41_48]|uniref:DUF916 domain-containing protein n=1 Tax=candidate division CPR2 bacterium GW2011_GWC1_41_48 TaxID=1618344 RepID=A0A0G0YH47_UNCC2|nr:MAG: hypothetical protein UT47_C0004G0032 [candidate division CPR2 bacterium GW2011_GWC2_39_35]KKS08876.1 MAG: hypothetical protein UU65_C0004G0087 [candidate division CPR2 bacterium GW2011_GWC1_41_48]
MKKTISVMLGVILSVALVSAPKLLKAADGGPESRGITVVPPNFELYANPGEGITEKLRVKNESSVQSTFQIVVEDFKAQGEDGGVELVDKEQSNSTFSLAKWIEPDVKTLTLGPGEEKALNFRVNVPKDAEPGGHYASILVSMGGDGNLNTSGASVASRIGSLVLLRVSGNVKEETTVESFTAPKYSEKAPVNFGLRVKNAGNNHVRPKGTIVITDIFGRKVAEVPLNGLNVLPNNTIRKMDTEWKHDGLLANRYTATLVATYGQQNKPLSASVSFIVFPKPLAAATAVGIVVLGLVVVKRDKVKKILHNLTK